MSPSARSARALPLPLTELLERVPDYRDYGRPGRAERQEAPWRLGVARAVKRYGDRLMGVAEVEGPLGGTESHAVDMLVSRVGDVVQQLSVRGECWVRPGDRGTRRELAVLDRRILSRLEDLLDRQVGLGRRVPVTTWLHAHAAPCYRQLRRLRRDVQRRNELLLVQGELSLPLAGATRAKRP